MATEADREPMAESSWVQALLLGHGRPVIHSSCIWVTMRVSGLGWTDFPGILLFSVYLLTSCFFFCHMPYSGVDGFPWDIFHVYQSTLIL